MKETSKQMEILLVDDYPLINDTIGNFLRDKGYLVHYAQTIKDALHIFENHYIDLVITDLKLNKEDGLEFIKHLKELNSNTEVIIITAHPEIDYAIESLRFGVIDFLRKPIDFKTLMLSIERTRHYHKITQENTLLHNKLNSIEKQDKIYLDSIVGKSEEMIEIKRTIKKIVEFPETSVLIEGESGTGKELIARAVHNEGPKPNSPFVPVNSSSIPETLIESELFGHEKGSFTDAKSTRKGLFEQANGGTIFLDEIGDITLPLQKSLLRVLENREIRYVGGNRIIKLNLRVVAATNKNLEQMVMDKQFRQDLFYRLNIFRIYVPPLRKRVADIPLLADYFLKTFNLKLRKNITGITDIAMQKLKEYSFPGNIRELRNIIEQAIILCDEDYLMPKHFPILIRKNNIEQTNISETLNIEKMEKAFIIEALKKANYNKTKACRFLGITRDSLRRKLDKYSLTVTKEMKTEDFQL